MSEPDPANAPAAHTPRRSVARKLGLSLLSTVVLLGLLELGCRIAGFGPDPGELQYEYDAQLQYLPRPSQETFFGRDDPATGERRQPVTINRHGMRGADFPQGKAPGEVRVVVLGDSLTFGPGVPDEAVWTSVLEERLHAAGRPEVRIANAAVNGWSAYHYRRWMESRSAALAPDLVLIGLYVGNDMVLAGAGGNALEPGVENALRRTALGDALMHFYREVLWKRQRARSLGTTVEDVEAELAQYAGIAELDLTLPQQRDLWQHALEHLAAIAAQGREAGVEVVCLLIPASWMTTKNDEDARLYDWLARQVAALGIPVIAPLEPLRAHRGELWLPWDPGHLAVSGHALLAELVAAELTRLGLP